MHNIKSRLKALVVLLFSWIVTGGDVRGQSVDSATSRLLELPAGYFSKLQSRTASLDRQISRRMTRYLDALARREGKLQQALSAKDSSVANRLFAGTHQKYQSWITALRAPMGAIHLPELKEYLPHLDSIATAVHYLQQSGRGGMGISPNRLAAIQAEGDQLGQLQGKWQQLRDIEGFVRQRQQQLKEQLTCYNLGKQLLGFNKEAFYYQQQLGEYKSVLQDKSRLEAKILSAMNSSPAFQQFMQKNSYLGRLFHLPDNYGTEQSLPGMQTKAQVQQLIGQQAGSEMAAGNSASDPGGYLKQKVDEGQQQLNGLKEKLLALGSLGGSGDMVMPQFTPNAQKVKTWLRRIQYGFSIQTQQSSRYFPATASLAMIAGYKLSDKAIVGVGASYQMGLGQGFNHIAFSSQGVGLRSYVDIKAKGNWWVTGGLEYNYLEGFNSWSALDHWDQWQKSALMGLTKKFKLSHNKGSAIQLLFDALYKQHVPPSSPILFRVGYTFN